MNDDAIRAAALAAEDIQPDPADLDQDGPDLDGLAQAGPPGDFDAPPPPAPDPDAPEYAGAQYPCNDYGNGQRLVLYCGENILFVRRLGWLRWDGRRWAADEDMIAVRRDAQGIAARIEAEAACVTLQDWQRDDLERWQISRADFGRLDAIRIKDRTEEDLAALEVLAPIRAAGLAARAALTAMRSGHIKHARASGNSPKITNMIAEAATLRSTDVGALNFDKDMLNCRNGVLHFRQVADAHGAAWGGADRRWDVSVLPHDRDQLITKMAEAEYHPAATAPAFEAFLERVQPDPEVRRMLQVWMGYNLLGRTQEQKLVFNYGSGRNGKSTFMDASAVVFADYGTTIPVETLTGSEQRKGSDATPDLVRLPGARFVRASEPDQGQRMKEALIKSLTGGEPIMIRRMHSEFVEITPEFKLNLSGNHKPEIRGADDGIWRRVLLVPWTVQIPESEVDKDLPARLKAERDGILAWMVAGALMYLEGGLPVPKAVSDATLEYRTQSDPMREFLMTQCEVTSLRGDFVASKVLRDAFNAWRLHNAEATFGSRTISNQIKERSALIKGPGGIGFEPGKTNGDTGYRGLVITAEALARVAQYSGELSMIGRAGR